MDVFFLTMGAAMVLAMHAGFAFLEVGTVRKKNQVNALVRVITDFGFSTIASNELMATSPDAPEAVPALMTLKPNQPTHKIHEPKARKGILEGRMALIRPSLP